MNGLMTFIVALFAPETGEAKFFHVIRGFLVLMGCIAVYKYFASPKFKFKNLKFW